MSIQMTHSQASRALAAMTIAAGLTLATFAAQAQTMDHSSHGGHADHSGHTMSAAPAPAPEAATAAPGAAAEQQKVMTNGEVTRWNASTGKVTIRHEEIKNLDMPAMTMVFALKNPDDGASLKAGDKVRFHVEAVNGALLITQIEAAAKA